MKRNEEASVHVTSSAVDSVPRPLSAIPATARVTTSSSPPPSQLANIILSGDLRSATNRALEPSIAASMASFSAATSFVGAANGSVLTTSSAPFNAQNSKNTNNGGAATMQVAAHQQHIFHQSLAQQQVRHNLATASIPACSPPAQSATQPGHQQQSIQTFQQMNAGQHGPGAQQFQRLKVEDALSYLDQVKYKFGNQPQVYNDFLDIMKEFKSQSIDTPGVIARVSSLFRGHPELIVGFNTFLPPGYKIEVQAEQVSVSVPGSLGVPAHIHRIPHGAMAPTTSTITQQLEVVARSTPPAQNVTVEATAAPQLQQPNLQTSAIAPSNSSATQLAVVASIKDEIPLVAAGGALTVKPAVSSPVAHAASVSSGGPGYGLGSLNKESSSSPQLGSAAHGYANSSSQGAAAAFGVPNASQPVEFNHAINYVNKIKNRFQGQPDIYKQFLEILHTYQKEQRSLKEGLISPINYRPTLTEAEVYAKVAQLFQNQEDLLQEFGQFLPDATNVSRSGSSIGSGGCGVGASGGGSGGGNGGSGLMSVSVPSVASAQSKKPSPVTEHASVKSLPATPSAIGGSGTSQTGTGQTGSSAAAKVPLKRAAPTTTVLPSSSPSSTSLGMGSGNQGPSIIPNKKPRLNSSKDYSVADVGKYGTMNELAFFDKVRRVACRSRDVYDNFLRCLVMYNQEIISKMELLQVTTPFLNRHPDLLKWFKDFLGLKETNMESHVEAQPISLFRSRIEREMLTSKDGKESRDREREALEIDYSTCKRLGTSYCALPKSYEAPKCSGRTPLCKEVLNETWVSFPSWSSEDSTFVSSRKTQYEEYIYRTEDERYELDIVLETHMSTIRVLEGVMKKLNRMNPDEAARFKLDDCLGGSSPTIHIRAIRRIYGDKASEIIEGLKRSPMVAIPVVLRRMKAKEEEWREAQKGFNKIWREQNEKYYLKSLDHLGTNFKQNDVKALRSKALINEIETMFEERNEENAQGKNDRSPSGCVPGGPHLKLGYKSRKVLDDAADLLIHHAKRQTGITKEDKRRIKTLLRHTIPDMFHHPRQELSEDEREDDDEEDGGNKKDSGKSSESASVSGEDGRKNQRRSGKVVINGRGGDAESREGTSTIGDDEDEEYTVFFANNHWYVFLRLHHILCERLSRVWDRANQLMEEEREEAAKTQRHSRINGRNNENVAVALRLKPKAEVEVDQYYSHFLSMVKNLLDGNVEASSYEDSLREMFGIHAYLVFTLDKVIANAVRQLGHLVTDEVCLQCTDIFLEEHGLKFSGHKSKGHDDRSDNDSASKKASVGGDMSYQRRMEQILSDENLYRIVLWHKEDDCTVAVEMLDTDSHSSCSGENPQIQDVQNWSNYVERYVSDRMDEVTEKTRRKNDPGGGLKVKKPVFLQRNLKQWERRRRKDVGSSSGSNPESLSQDASGDVKMDIDMKDVAVREDAHCVFNVNSYQMVFVANSESVLYKRHAFSRAKQCHRAVTLQMRNRFRTWQQQWASANVTTEAENQCLNWLLGKGDHLELKTNSRTVRVSTNVEHRAPFGQLVKYRVDYDS